MGISRTTWVERLVSKDLRAQGRPDPRGGFCCFWCPNETSTPSIDTSDTLKIVKNRLELRKFTTDQSRGGQELKTNRHRTFQSRLSNNQKILVRCSVAIRVER
jgi:hypothetical protein